METKHIRYFCTVYEQRSINKAAKQLYISPQGLSKIIGQLEAELNAELFLRTKQGMVPTETGTYFYKYSRSIFYKLEELEYGIRRIQDREKEMRIGFSCGTLNLFDFCAVRDLSKEFPDFHVQWEEDNNQGIISKAEKGELDLAFVIGDQIPEELEQVQMYSASPRAIVYEGHPFYEREQICIYELKDEPLITLNEKFHTYHELLRRCHDFGFSPNIIARTMESPLIYRFVKEKHGIGVDVDIHSGYADFLGLRRIPIAEAFSWEIRMIYKKEKREEYPMDALCRCFRKAWKQE